MQLIKNNIMSTTETTHATGYDIFIKLNDVRICYDDLGSGAVPIIFIHGFPFDKSSWRPQMEFLKETQRVIAYDIRGFGKSTSGKDEQSISLFASDLINFMDALKIHKAILCGLSMGGYILSNAVNKYPDRFKAIILSDTQCIADSPEAKEKRYQVIAKIKEDGISEFTESFIKNAFCAETLENKKEVVEKIRTVILSTLQVSIAGTLSAIAEREETCSSLKAIAIPTLIICGSEDKITPFAQSEFLHSTIANSKLQSIDSAGHLSNLEQPEEFNQRISDFISRLTK